MKINPKKVLLIDAFGAVISTLLLGLVLIHFEKYIGMPTSTLYLLAGIAATFMIYSFTCYFFVQKNRAFFIRMIAIANTLYCFVSIGFVIYHFSLLTPLGITYFLVEFIVLILIINFEFKSIKSEALN